MSRASAALLALILSAGPTWAQAPSTPAPLAHEGDRRAFCANVALLVQAALADFAAVGPDRPVPATEGAHVVGPVFRESSREIVRRTRSRGGGMTSQYSAQFRDSAQLRDRMAAVLRDCHPGIAPVARDASMVWRLADGVLVETGLTRDRPPAIILTVSRSLR